MMIGMIAIGIAVDDTVHFLTRLRLEASRVQDMDEALWRTFRFTGRAIVHTSIILCLGLLPFLLSDYLTTRANNIASSIYSHISNSNLITTYNRV